MNSSRKLLRKSYLSARGFNLDTFADFVHAKLLATCDASYVDLDKTMGTRKRGCLFVKTVCEAPLMAYSKLLDLFGV